MDIRPDFGLPAMVVNGGHATGSASGVPLRGLDGGSRALSRTEFDKDGPDVFNFILLAHNVFIAQKIAKMQATRRNLRFDASREGYIFHARVLGGIKCHPEGFSQGHGLL